MMYQGKMAFAVKVAGKILREHGETVYLPFGSEYTLLIKNLNNRRACVRITLDGQEVVDGGLVVNANSSVDLERFIKPGQLDKGNRFKFIERTGKVEAARGIQLEDGLLRVEFEFEKPEQKTVWPSNTVTHHIYHNHHTYPPLIGQIYGSTGVSGSLSDKLLGSAGGEVYTSSFAASASASAGPTLQSQAKGPLKSATRSLNRAPDVEAKADLAGITVPGSVSEQKFVSVNFDGDGITQVMVLRLLGETETAPVKEAITVKTKQKCTTCNHVNKATAKFCSECGTGLEIV